MRIFKFKDGELIINKDEIFLFPSFYTIFTRDKQTGRPIAFAELKYIYFVADIDAVPYKRGYDNFQTVEYAIQHSNLPKGWQPDRVIEEAINIYKEDNMNVVTTTVREILMIFNNYAVIVRKLRFSIEEHLKKDKLSKDEMKELLGLLDGIANIAAGIPNIKSKLYQVIKEIELVTDKDAEFIRGLGEIVPQSANPEADY